MSQPNRYPVRLSLAEMDALVEACAAILAGEDDGERDCDSLESARAILALKHRLLVTGRRPRGKLPWQPEED